MSGTSSELLENGSVQRVRAALRDLGAGERVIALAESARTAAEAAAALGCPVGAIVKSLVFADADGAPVMALVAGDRMCDTAVLGQVFGLSQPPARAAAALVRAATGFAIGGVAPLGHPAPLRIAIDASLQRFSGLYAAAGHPMTVFPASFDELRKWTAAKVAEGLGREH